MFCCFMISTLLPHLWASHHSSPLDRGFTSLFGVRFNGKASFSDTTGSHHWRCVHTCMRGVVAYGCGVVWCGVWVWCVGVCECVCVHACMHGVVCVACGRCGMCVWWVWVYMCVINPVIDSVFSHASISHTYAPSVWMCVLCPYMRCCVFVYTWPNTF